MSNIPVTFPSSLDVAREALKSVKNQAAEGRKTPGGHVRVGEFWYGDPGEESVIAFRQGTKAQMKACEATEASPAVERAKHNKRTVAACVLWYHDITPESTAEMFETFMDGLEELYPMIWGELIGAWSDHNHGARADLRGKA